MMMRYREKKTIKNTSMNNLLQLFIVIISLIVVRDAVALLLFTKPLTL